MNNSSGLPRHRENRDFECSFFQIFFFKYGHPHQRKKEFRLIQRRVPSEAFVVTKIRKNVYVRAAERALGGHGSHAFSYNEDSHLVVNCVETLGCAVGVFV